MILATLCFVVVGFSHISMTQPSKALPTKGTSLTLNQLKALRMELEKLIDTSRLRSEMKDLEDVINAPPRLGKRAKISPQAKKGVNLPKIPSSSKKIVSNVHNLKDRINEIIHEDFSINSNNNSYNNNNNNKQDISKNEIGNLTKNIDSFSRETTLMTLKILYQVLMRLQDVNKLQQQQQQQQVSRNEESTTNNQKKAIRPPRLG